MKNIPYIKIPCGLAAGSSQLFKRKSAVINNFKAVGTIKTGVKKKAPGAQIKGLAEAILLQSMEDLWIYEERSNCIDFFSGEGFRICSEIAGMSCHDKVKILNIVRDIINQNSGKDKKVIDMRADRAEVYKRVR